MTTAQIGIIGGSGFYEFLDRPEQITLETPYGPPSAPISVGTVAGGERTVAFVPRHGRHHEHPPHRVNYRANLWALRSLGVRQVLGPCAVGSLRPDLNPGTFVVPDQVVDRTWGREHTLVDGAPVVHVGFADPYCPRGRRTVLEVGGGDVVDGGTLVVINGPRFSSRAESQWHAAQGWSLVGMTGMPEASIARELALCYSTVAMVTDHDAGVDAGEAVSHAAVMEIFGRNVDRLRGLLAGVIPALPADAGDADESCPCRRSLDGFRPGWL